MATCLFPTAMAATATRAAAERLGTAALTSAVWMMTKSACPVTTARALQEPLSQPALCEQEQQDMGMGLLYLREDGRKPNPGCSELPVLLPL